MATSLRSAARHRPPRLSRTRRLYAQEDCLERKAFVALVDRTLRDIALIVSSRGICALQAGQLAELPPGDLDLIAASCECEDCAGSRLH